MGGALSSASAAGDCKPRAGQVSVYEHSDFKGLGATSSSGQFLNGTKLAPVGGDAITSIRIGKGASAELFSDDNPGGKSLVVTKNTMESTDSDVGHDSTSSVLVKRKTPDVIIPSQRASSMTTGIGTFTQS